MKKISLLLTIIIFKNLIIAQTGFTDAIEDNSFFIEEAYNQEPGVVQHIFTGLYFSKPTDEISLSLTQEWPLFSQSHQFSYTIPYSSFNSVSGINDILIHYRYQLLQSDDWAAVSPRISLIIPTGDFEKGFGDDVLGFQVNLPASKRWTNEFITHANAGFTILPNIKSPVNQNSEHTLTSYNAGLSFIWLANENYNFMLEYAANFISIINQNDETVIVTENIINPGFRFAINAGDLQIVPGLAVPISFFEGENKVGVFLYLSFEHSF